MCTDLHKDLVHRVDTVDMDTTKLNLGGTTIRTKKTSNDSPIYSYPFELHLHK